MGNNVTSPKKVSDPFNYSRVNTSTLVHELGHVYGLYDNYVLANSNWIMYGIASATKNELTRSHYEAYE